MAKRGKKKPQGLSPAPAIEPNAAGVDIGATEIYVAVAADRDAQPVRRFATWMGLCPDNRVSGGKVLSSHTRAVNNRAARALRLAAQSLFRSQSWLGQYYRRMRAKLGAPKAITAAAHKLARIVFHLLTTRHAYDESVFAHQEMQNKQRIQQKLRHQAQLQGFQLVPLTTI